ncbi:MAG: aldo/keto reductase [Bdellovibrionales bacterium]|nr:aldo/keto reductase [Bdellovibrionales bacterium]
MEYTKLGNTDITVSRICYGSWRLAGWDTKLDQGFLDTVSKALDYGVTFFDTAEAYGDGHAEHLLGRVFKGKRQDVVIATKFPFQKSSPDQIRKSVERSLRRLQTDYIDLYQQHWPPKKPPLHDAIETLQDLKREGKIRAIGVSNWMEPEWEEFGEPKEIDSLQPCYSLLWRSIESSVLPLCQEHNLAVIPYSPLCQGLLTGKFTSLKNVPLDVRQKNRIFAPGTFEKALGVVARVVDIANELKKTPSQVALRWLLDHPGITAPIVGASSPSQIEDNCGACGWSLPEEMRLELSELSAPLSEGLNPHDTLWDWHPRR